MSNETIANIRRNRLADMTVAELQEELERRNKQVIAGEVVDDDDAEVVPAATPDQASSINYTDTISKITRCVRKVTKQLGEDGLPINGTEILGEIALLRDAVDHLEEGLFSLLISADLTV